MNPRRLVISTMSDAWFQRLHMFAALVDGFTLTVIVTHVVDSTYLLAQAFMSHSTLVAYKRPETCAGFRWWSDYGSIRWFLVRTIATILVLRFIQEGLNPGLGILPGGHDGTIQRSIVLVECTKTLSGQSDLGFFFSNQSVYLLSLQTEGIYLRNGGGRGPLSILVMVF